VSNVASPERDQSRGHPSRLGLGEVEARLGLGPVAPIDLDAHSAGHEHVGDGRIVEEASQGSERGTLVSGEPSLYPETRFCTPVRTERRHGRQGEAGGRVIEGEGRVTSGADLRRVGHGPDRRERPTGTDRSVEQGGDGSFVAAVGDESTDHPGDHRVKREGRHRLGGTGAATCVGRLGGISATHVGIESDSPSVPQNDSGTPRRPPASRRVACPYPTGRPE
jgi:hypothetical protein